MTEDYSDAADRHFADAQLLHEQMPPRLANASHLYGVAAECALKCIISQSTKGGGKVPRVHLPELLDQLSMHSVAKGNADLVKRVKKSAEGLCNWRVEQRYDNQTVFIVANVVAEAASAQKLLALRKHHARGII